jgi:drug/metabolite transporter (DMT)-like permease
LAGISYGLFSAFSSTVSSKDHSVFLLASILSSWILIIILSYPELDQVRSLSIFDIMIAAALGALLNGVGYISWTRANRLAKISNVNISSIASIMYLVPLLSLVIVAILLGEELLFQFYFIFSLILVIASSIICQKIASIEKVIYLWLQFRGKRHIS